MKAEEAAVASFAHAEEFDGSCSLIDELEKATHEASPEKRVQMLRRVTDLFVGSASRINQDQIDLFGTVLGQMISEVENTALAELGAKLAPIGNAPYAIIRDLARNDEIAVAGPVLAHSSQLSDQDLIEISRTKSQQHLGSISERRQIAAAVTDILVERGDTEVLHKVSGNQGAAFSSAGFQQLTKRAAGDDVLTQNLAQRLDLPTNLLQVLISQATEALRERLLAAARPNERAAIQAAIASASIKLLQQAIGARDFTKAEAVIATIAKNEQLNEATLLSFANARKYEELVVGIAHLSSAPVSLIDQLMTDARHEGILVACKAASLHWPTLHAILVNRFTYRQLNEAEIEHARFDFLKLSAATARRALRFWVIRGTADMHVAVH